MKISLKILAIFLGLLFVAPFSLGEVFLGQGCMSGEVTESSVYLQTRLTASQGLNKQGDLTGVAGVVAFEWSVEEGFANLEKTAFLSTEIGNDFLVRTQLTNLSPKTRYYYRAHFGENEKKLQVGPVCSFKTLPGGDGDGEVTFIVGSCMNYCKFMYGRDARASGPVTATDEDKRLGYPALDPMREMKPDFFVGTGDIVYYDNPARNAKTLPELRKCWHEQFRFQRMKDFLQDVPSYWSKDDHDFRYNDSDNSGGEKWASAELGIKIFKEQLPIGPLGNKETKTYRTHRVSEHLQIWFTEGRDYRSPNKMKDGPEKTLWGAEQLTWLQRTLKESDAKWKLLITPTPLVGPDDAYKKDNHVNEGGFQYEANVFFDWLEENAIENFMTVCGDRHWQYHSIHPNGHEEFACGALNDENSRMGRAPGSPKSTDPEALIKQLFSSPQPRGGFVRLKVGESFSIEYFTATGEKLYEVSKK
ncbi:MAG: alkaline phosphatase D family protein [Roseibacillus sp.]